MAEILCQEGTDDQITFALNRSMRECGGYPVRLPHILQRMAGTSDGRPGVEEAWASCPKDEETSCVWTQEMCEAFGAARPLLRDGDSVGARMTFKEVYSRLVENARREGVSVRWEPSLGWDKGDRVRALAEAVEKKRFRADAALNLLAPQEQTQLLMALTVGTEKQLPGETEPITGMLPGFLGLLQQLRMEGAVPAGCDPGPPKPGRQPMTTDELEERRAQLRNQAELLMKKALTGAK